MDSKEYFSAIDAEYTENTIGEDILGSIESELGISFGQELKKYVLEFGYLAYQYIEYYGINSVQGLESDMIKQTLYLHQYFEKTKGLVALGSLNEGRYALVSSEDVVFEYDSELDTLMNTEKKLFDYIMDSFESIRDEE